MLRAELKKILIYQKGLSIILVALFAYAALCIWIGCDSSYEIDRNEELYLSYMERWQGVVTEENSKEMEKEYYEVNHADDGRKTAFMVIFNQYYYAKEDVAHRYLLDERGWNTLLTHDRINFILLLCLFTVSVPVFCVEYQCGMDQIFRSSKYGRSKLAYMKLMTLIVLNVIITVLFQIVQLVITALSVGIAGSSYPLQSLSFFEQSPYAVTIGQAYAIIFCCRLIGAAWLALLIALFSILLRRSVLTTFAGIVVSVLPHLIGRQFVKYVLPLPAGMLSGVGYVWGTLTEAGYDSEWNLTDVVTFPGVTPKELYAVLLMALFAIVVLFCFCIRCYVGAGSTHTFKRFAPMLLCSLLATYLTGCAKSENEIIVHDFLAYAAEGENDAYTVALDMLTNTIYATDKNTGETILLTRDPLDTKGGISSIFVSETACFYVVQGNAGEGFEIYRIDLDSFGTCLFYSNTTDNISTFWGLYQPELSVDDILADAGAISSFVVDGANIYYMQHHQLYMLNRLTGYEKVVASCSGNVTALLYQNGEVIIKEE